ncbi:11992_t:CDS:2 [Funneliformis mosseae]|uniref:11992_t:CDS:1 n=1 Tax=Funneliformis mosseae TaxID=27381 RepID=A0A9N9HAP5_FUNMO|nr:11992_t:CDS:2 [Funneliformis mosseae]
MSDIIPNGRFSEKFDITLPEVFGKTSIRENGLRTSVIYGLRKTEDEVKLVSSDQDESSEVE